MRVNGSCWNLVFSKKYVYANYYLYKYIYILLFAIFFAGTPGIFGGLVSYMASLMFCCIFLNDFLACVDNTSGRARYGMFSWTRMELLG